MSVADLIETIVTMARLLEVCSCSLVTALLTAPLNAAIVSS